MKRVLALVIVLLLFTATADAQNFRLQTFRYTAGGDSVITYTVDIENLADMAYGYGVDTLAGQGNTTYPTIKSIRWKLADVVAGKATMPEDSSTAWVSLSGFAPSPADTFFVNQFDVFVSEAQQGKVTFEFTMTGVTGGKVCKLYFQFYGRKEE